MTLPAPTFTAVAPPPDGLSLAFSAARRRRNSKAAMSAFAGAVAITSALSFLAPPGQSLVQEPPPPASGDLLTGDADTPRHGAPASPVRTSVADPALRPAAAFSTTVPGTAVNHRAVTSGAATARHGTCRQGRRMACLVVRPSAPGGPRMVAAVCPSAATVTVEYDAPPVGPTPTSIKRTVAVGSCPA
jgi:hypothetical protein